MKKDSKKLLTEDLLCVQWKCIFTMKATLPKRVIGKMLKKLLSKKGKGALSRGGNFHSLCEIFASFIL
jgi:hypothetical protein